MAKQQGRYWCPCSSPLWPLCPLLMLFDPHRRLSCSLLSALALLSGSTLCPNLSPWKRQIAGPNYESFVMLMEKQWTCQQSRDVHLKKTLPGSRDLLWCWSRWDQTFGFSDFDSLIMSGALWDKEICAVLTGRSYLVLCFDSLNPRWTVSKIWEVPGLLPSVPAALSPLHWTRHRRWGQRERTVNPCCFCVDEQTEWKTPLPHISVIHRPPLVESDLQSCDDSKNFKLRVSAVLHLRWEAFC